MPFSVPTMWKLTYPIKNEERRAFDVFAITSNRMTNLFNTAISCYDNSSLCKDEEEGSAGIIGKLTSLKDDIGKKSVAYALLRNVPEMSFHDIFDELGHQQEDTIRNCSNNGIKCKGIDAIDSGLFPQCYQYETSENMAIQRISDEGISSGVSFILMTAGQLGSLALKAEQQTFVFFAFDNTYSSYSADGMRLMITSPGEIPDMNERGINLSPGFSYLISMTGKEVKRLSWPYSSCTEKNEEFEMLQESVRKSKEFKPSGSDLDYEYVQYTADECRASCYQRFIYQECNCLDVNSILPYPSRSLSLILCGTLSDDEMNKFLNESNQDTKACFQSATTFSSAKCRFMHQWIEDLFCLKEAKQKYAQRRRAGQHDCNCPSACQSFHYDLSVTSSRWPSPGAEMNAAYQELVFRPEHKWNFGYNEDENVEGASGSGNNVTGQEPGNNTVKPLTEKDIR